MFHAIVIADKEHDQYELETLIYNNTNILINLQISNLINSVPLSDRHPDSTFLRQPHYDVR